MIGAISSERRSGRDDSFADLAVALHERALLVVERAWLVEDRVRDRRLADVVELRGQSCPVGLLGRQVEANGGAPGEDCDMVEVVDEVPVLLGEHLQEHVLYLGAGIAPCSGALVRVEPLVCDMERLLQRDCPATMRVEPTRAADRETEAALAERGLRRP